jgi:hypothetical protein
VVGTVRSDGVIESIQAYIVSRNRSRKVPRRGDLLMRQFTLHLLLATAIAIFAAPGLASAGAGGCARRDRRVTEVTLIVALIATGAGLGLRRSRIGWDDTPPDR